MVWMVAGSTMVHAHPGHDILESSPAHVFSSPYHLLCLGAAGLACFIAAKFTASKVRRKILLTAGCCLVAAGAAFQLF